MSIWIEMKVIHRYWEQNSRTNRRFVRSPLSREMELYKKTAARRLFKTFPAEPLDDRAWKVQRFTKESIYLYAFYLYAYNNEFAILKIYSSNKNAD